MKKTSKAIATIMAMVIVVLAILAMITSCSSNTEPEIKDVYSLTRTALKEKCVSLFEENDIPVGDKVIEAWYHSVWEESLYFNDYPIEGDYNYFLSNNAEDYNDFLYTALVIYPDDEKIQKEAVELIERLDFQFKDNKIIYADTIDATFDEINSEVTNVESEFKEALKDDLINLLNSEDVEDPDTIDQVEPVRITNFSSGRSFIIVTSENNDYSIQLYTLARKNGIKTIEMFQVFFPVFEEAEIAEALITGKEIALPEYSYELTPANYIQATLENS